MLNKNIVNVIANAYITIDDKDNVIVNVGNMYDGFYEEWNNLTNEEQKEYLKNRFVNIHSLQFR